MSSKGAPGGALPAASLSNHAPSDLAGGREAQGSDQAWPWPPAPHLRGGRATLGHRAGWCRPGREPDASAAREHWSVRAATHSRWKSGLEQAWRRGGFRKCPSFVREHRQKRPEQALFQSHECPVASTGSEPLSKATGDKGSRAPAPGVSEGEVLSAFEVGAEQPGGRT